jgi:hypothetical protein
MRNSFFSLSVAAESATRSQEKKQHGFCAHYGVMSIVLTVRFWPFSTDHGYKACWSNPMQSVVRTNANDWSGGMQTGVQVECNFAVDQVTG